jgi:threonyl-tRNA synthetase
MSVTAILPDGTSKEFDSGASARTVAESISAGLARAAVAARVDGDLTDLDRPIPDGKHEVQLLTDRDDEALEVLRHTAAHIMAQAVCRLYGPGVQYTIGPALTDDFQYGFYYDFDLPEGKSISADDLEAIEAEMKKIVSEKLPLQRNEMDVDAAKARMTELGQQYKIEMIDDMLAGEPATALSFYGQGDFLDMCRGPHLPDTGKLGKAFKLLSVAGAYWRGDESKAMLTRIYGVAFFDNKQLAAHLERVEEARKRDHRLLGKQLELFLLDEKVGPGMALWLPKGAILRHELESWLRGHLTANGYQMVNTPHIGRLDLWQTSGHYPYYRDSQFPAMFRSPAFAALGALWDALHLDEPARRIEQFRRMQAVLNDLNPEMASELLADGAIADEIIRDNPDDLEHRINEIIRHHVHSDAAGFLLKPMNCPFHVQIYAHKQRSYRELPLRLAEFGQVYRWEQSGELNGLTRVRGFCQDDAHIFCTPEQVEQEIASCVDLVKLVLGTLGLSDYRVRIGLRDPDSDKYVGQAEHWAQAEENIRHVVKNSGMDYTEETGEAAFYGPKIDFLVTDCIGRQWQLGTVQVDYNLPERFGLEYVGADNQTHRPVMIHRAPFGSLERFIGILIEHFGGAFPVWLSPVQAAVLPVSDKYNDYAATVEQALADKGLRVELDDSPDKVGAKIRRATLAKVPYMLIVGEREADAGTVALRERTEGDLGTVSIESAAAALANERDTRGEQTVKAAMG